MRTLILKLILLGSTLVSLACSQQSRDTDWDPTSEELDSVISTLFTQARSSTSQIGLLDAAEQSITSIEQPGVFYLASSGGPGEGTGLPASVASLRDFTILGMEAASLYDVAEAKVLLVDTFTTENREFTLIVQVKFFSGESSEVESVQTRIFSTRQYEFTDDKLILNFANFDLESFDLSDVEEDLSPVIQLKIFDKNGLNFGKFSTLLGFGG